MRLSLRLVSVGTTLAGRQWLSSPPHAFYAAA